MTLGELLHQGCLEKPAETFLYCGDQTMSWEEFDQSTSRLAAWLLEQGLDSGDRVAIHWSNRIQTAQLFLGAFKAGMIAVPINTRLKPPEISYILDHSGARICFSEPALAPLVAEAGAGSMLRDLPQLEPVDVPLPHVDPDQPCVIMYTSGTTARPKGVIHTHRTLIAGADFITQATHLDRRSRTLVVTPMMHVGGLCAALLPAIYSRGSAVLLPAFQPAAALDAIQRFRCTYALILPAMMHAVAEEQAREPRDVASIQSLIGTGDSVPVSLQDRVQSLFALPLQEGYGGTEAGILTCNPKHAIRQGSVGVVQTGVKLRVVDLQDHDVPDGETGEIVVQSPVCCKGYWNDAEATAALLRNGWLHTGDLASRDAGGYYWFKGRKKEIIVRGGSNISPQEVEEGLYQHPSVMEVGVVGLPDPVLGERVVAFVVVRPENIPSEHELIEFARLRLADYKTPERILFVGQLPKGLTGKVQRRALKELLIAQPGLLGKHAIAGG
jgi:long-chain acyl-CoA synthetase